MSSGPSYVILGGGLAGHSAAITLHHSGFDGQIVLISDEPIPPYDRPPLSKSYLQDKKDASSLLFQSAQQYEAQGVELMLSRRATGVDFARRRIRFEDGGDLGYDKLLIATGATPIRLNQPGFDLNGVHYLRTLADATALRERLTSVERVLVIGGGFIGSEVAASARILGCQVTLVDLADCLMKLALGEQIGAIYCDIHRRRGVDLRLASRVTELRGAGRVEEAIFEDGARLACDLVVVGVGVRPEVSIFEGTELELENGVLVDEHCRTNLPNVFAAGDVANWWHPVIKRRLRVEHFDNAALQGKHAAHAMLDQPEPYAPVPYFWSDQYDVNMQYVGFPGDWDELIVRGDLEQPAVTGFYLRDGLAQAAVTINQPRELRAARRIVEARVPIDPKVLADPAIDLRALSRELTLAG